MEGKIERSPSPPPLHVIVPPGMNPKRRHNQRRRPGTDVNFRQAIRAAWPNVGGIQHRLDRYLSMDYEDMDWAAPSKSHRSYAKTHARWEQIEREKEVFVNPTI